MINHRWSGWPGAYCLKCWAADPRELCLADRHEDDCDRPECQESACTIPDPPAAEPEPKPDE